MPVLSVLIIIIMCPYYGACCTGAVVCSFVKTVDDTSLNRESTLNSVQAQKNFSYIYRTLHYIY